MAVDTPARIAVLGAGPIGLETALYARYLGYTVDVYERGRVAEHLLRWGHVTLFTPFEQNASTLGIAALRTQDEAWRPPLAGERLTGRELVERYFLPLAQSDLLIDGLQEGVEVIGIGREGLIKSDFALDERRADYPFRLLLRDSEGVERIEQADVVVDCSGTFGTPNRLGNGGLPAIGETTCDERIEYGLPDVLGDDRERYAGRHTLVVGGGYSAATTVVALARLAADVAETRITWVTRREMADEAAGPVPHLPNDRLGDRETLAQQANLLTLERNGPLTHWPATFVESVSFDGAAAQFQVEFAGRHGGHATFDRIVANVGYRPDHRLYDELQVQRHPATDGAPLLQPAHLPTPTPCSPRARFLCARLEELRPRFATSCWPTALSRFARCSRSSAIAKA